MRLSLASLTLAGVMALAASASANQIHQRYTACNERAVAALASEPYPARMLSPMIPAMCKDEEDALVVQEYGRKILRERMDAYNQRMIERVRLERRWGFKMAD